MCGCVFFPRFTSRNRHVCAAIFCLLCHWFSFIIVWCVTLVSAYLCTCAKRQKIVVALICAFIFCLVIPWLREVHAAKAFVLLYILPPPPLNTTVLLHRFLLTLSFCAFQLFICLHPAFASDTVGTEFWARKSNRDISVFPFYSFCFCLLGDGSQFFCFSLLA